MKIEKTFVEEVKPDSSGKEGVLELHISLPRELVGKRVRVRIVIEEDEEKRQPDVVHMVAALTIAYFRFVEKYKKVRVLMLADGLFKEVESVFEEYNYEVPDYKTFVLQVNQAITKLRIPYTSSVLREAGLDVWDKIDFSVHPYFDTYEVVVGLRGNLSAEEALLVLKPFVERAEKILKG